MLLPLAFVYFHSGAPLRVEDLKIVGAVAIAGVVVVSLCGFATPRFRGVAAVLMGVLCGIGVLVFGGYVLARLVGGFEASAAIFTGALAVSIPSGIAGGIVGWLNRLAGGTADMS